MTPKQFLAIFLTAMIASCALAPAQAGADPAPAGNTGWVWANPLPQGNSLDLLTESGGRVWVGGRAGTLMHSNDLGATWTAIRTGLLDDITAVETISPNSVVFSSSCAVRRTDDGGKTIRRLAWSANDSTCTATIRAISFPSPMTGYMLLSSGDVYFSSDGGENWAKRSQVPDSAAAGGAGAVRDIRFDLLGRGVVSVGTKILYSTDAGVSWNTAALTASGGGLYNFSFVNDSIGFAAGENGEFLSTTDGGATWSVVPGDGAIAANSFSSISCADSQLCIIVRADGSGLFRTTDGGGHWSGVTTGADLAAILLPGGKGVSVGKAGSIAVTENSGESWRLVNAQARGTFSAIRSHSKQLATLVGGAGVIGVSDNGGSSWRTVPTPSSAAMLDAFVSGSKVLGLASDGKLWRSDDSASSWSSVDTGSKQKSRAMLAWKDGRVILIGPRGVRVSKRWGEDAKPASGPITKLVLSKAVNAGKASFVYGSRSIAATLDRGKSWQRLKLPRGAASIVDIDMQDALRGYLLDANAELFVTKDGAKSWTRNETTGANTATSVAFGDRKHGYLADTTGRILATADGGSTWTRQYPFFDSKAVSPVMIEAASPRTALALVAGSDRVFKTTSGGGIGRSSTLKIKPSATRVKRGTVVPVTGTLTPATGVERVAVLARVQGARGGTQWASQNVTVSASGTFTTKWKIIASTVFIARWSGDAYRDGDAALAKRVTVRR